VGVKYRTEQGILPYIGMDVVAPAEIRIARIVRHKLGGRLPTTAAPYIGQIMELCADKGLESVVRVLPTEPRHDIGYAILSKFHYSPGVRIITCDNVEAAASHLAE
jgi:hypothetical protein